MIKKIELNKNFRIANNISSKFPYVVEKQQRTKVAFASANANAFEKVTATAAKQPLHQSFLKHEEYLLETFKRSNQDTCLTHKPSVIEGSWVQSGELLTDCASSVGGELSLGQNLLIAYMPWEGYNFEDAILISERLVMDDLYTSIHIERYELETQKTKLGAEEITRNIPDVSEQEIAQLDSFGVVKLGSWVEEGDILVGKITPINKKKISPYQKLLYSILEKQVRPIKDSSLRAPKGIKAKVIDIKYFYKSVTSLKQSSLVFSQGEAKAVSLRTVGSTAKAGTVKVGTAKAEKAERVKTLAKATPLSLRPQAAKGLHQSCTGSEATGAPKVHRNGKKGNEGEKKGKKKINSFLKKMNLLFSKINYSSFNIRFLLFCSRFWPLLAQKRVEASLRNLAKQKTKRVQKDKIKKAIFSNFSNSHIFKTTTYSVLFKKPSQSQSQRADKNYNKSTKNIETIHIYLAEKRKIQVGDKMAGRHGNKGIVSQILPIQDMPFLPDGTPIDMVLNPLGVPSRMNVGQIYECLLGFAGKFLGENYKIYSFDEIYGPEASRSFVFNKLYEASTKTGFQWLFDPNSPGKIRLFDGRNGEFFDQKVTVGLAYMLRLVHMVDDKIHMRSTGPYSLVTQQPLRGRSKQGGQRLGEMEVWALEGYGAAFTLLEMLTIKSDDMTGRMTLWSNLILNKDISIGTPESFKVLICELQALCLDIGLYRSESRNTETFGKKVNLNLREIQNLMNLP